MTENESTIGRDLEAVFLDVEQRSTLGKAFVGVVRRSQVARDAAFIELQGATGEDALRLAELQQPPDEDAADDAAAQFEHDAALRSSGLGFDDSGTLRIRILDGAQFTATLGSIDRETASEDLRTSLEHLVYRNLHIAAESELSDHEADVEKLFAPNDVPSWAQPLGMTETNTAQTTDHMPGIVEGLRHVGADTARFADAAHIEAIKQDGDLWRWAMAGHMGFVPDLELPNGIGHVYDIFTNGQDWDVVASMLRSARPGGAFVTVVGGRVSGIIDQQMASLVQQIDEPMDEYVTRETELEDRLWKERVRDDDDDYDSIDLRMSPVQLEQVYQANREYAMRHLATLRAAAIDIHEVLKTG